MNAPGGWPWAAGLFEGEGCITQNRGRPRLFVTSTDEDVVLRFHKIVGCGTVKGPYRRDHPTNKPYWHWSAGAYADVRSTLEMLQPYLLGRRAARAQEALDYYATLEKHA